MFRDHRQMCRALETLLGHVSLSSLWDTETPSEQFWDYYEQGGGPLSSGERAVVLAVAAIWARSNDKLSLADAFHALDGTLSRALWGLLLAASTDDRGEAVDGWLHLWRRP